VWNGVKSVLGNSVELVKQRSLECPNIDMAIESDGRFLSKGRFVTVIIATKQINQIVTSTIIICAKKGVERFKIKEELSEES
jgi:hypothetical protein